MSAYTQIQSTADTAIQELEAEITDLEEQSEAHKLRIQNARIQIQALKKFLSPEENGQAQTNSDRLSEAVMETLVEIHPQSVHYKDLADLISRKGYDITGKQPDKTVLNCLMKMARAGKAKNTGKGYYEAASGKEEEVREAFGYMKNRTFIFGLTLYLRIRAIFIDVYSKRNSFRHAGINRSCSITWYERGNLSASRQVADKHFIYIAW